MNICRFAFLPVLLLAASSVFAQQFEVASIHVVDQKRLEQECGNSQPGRRGGPRTEDPQHVSYRCQPLQWLVREAFGFTYVEAFRMPNLEARIEWTQFVDLTAVVPSGLPADQYPALLGNLLAGRYHLKTHEEMRDGDVYSLMLAPNGHKLKRHTDPVAANTLSGREASPGVGPDGLLALSPVDGRVLATGNRSHWRILGSNVSVQPLAERIEGILHAPVSDGTGLSGKFDFRMDFDPGYGSPADSGVSFPLLPTALREQLGLTIQKTRGRVKVVMIDSIDPEPTEN